MNPSAARALLAVALAVATATTAGGGTVDPARSTAPGIEPTDGLVEGARPDAWALLVEAGTVRRAPDDGAALLAELGVGTLVPYQGESTDDFGRPWSRIAVGDSVERGRRVVLSTIAPRRLVDLGTTAALDPPGDRLGGSLYDLGAVGGPGEARGGRRRGAAPEGDELPPWWTRVLAVGPQHLPEVVDVRSLVLPAVPRQVATTALELLGGRQALGSWPEEPLLGQLHVPPAFPVLFRWDGERWEPGDPAQLWGHSLGLLANPDLVADPDAPTVAGSQPVACWRLVGAFDAYGASAGGLQPATDVATPDAAGDAWRPDALGRRDLSSIILPVAPESTRVPPALPPELPEGGVELRDTSRRQAVYLEQELSPSITGRLRGRTVVLRVRARRPTSAGGPGLASVGLVLEGGGERAEIGSPVGDTPTWTELEFTVPSTAERLRVRLLPADPSLVVEGGGTVVVDRAVLGLPDWPREARPAARLLFRVAATVYRPTPGFTRSRLVVTRRPEAEIRELLPILNRADWPTETKERIVAGEVASGMSARQVRLAWGEPASRREPPEVDGIDARWDWPDRSAAFVNDELISWTVGASPADGERPSPCLPGSGP